MRAADSATTPTLKSGRTLDDDLADTNMVHKGDQVSTARSEYGMWTGCAATSALDKANVSAKAQKAKHEMNKIEITGNVTSNMTLETAATGKQYAKFSVASDRSRKRDSETDFFRAVAFDEVAVHAAAFGKGAFVRLTGSVQLGMHDEKPTTEVIVRRIESAVREAEEIAASA